MGLNGLREFAQQQRGQGWLGAMNIIDYLENSTTSISRDQAIQIKEQMELVFGRLILSGDIGHDEFAMQRACNECIEAAIACASAS